ncbi:hypothetical protein DFA_12286 [Cavenderia fasciculata]|uniref:2'-5' RNA ligase n=1 Tax=Cavenderia fasciculata TaxID=261658 RepID=F4QD39_CACFS|nr:uncharacterized protein DFA_12286 [Cavenderia fasciculata]EGG14510.1 hypothetical protein DFA_12286 [Cavenderia fasciculata]|eukprot:XP_004353923.1 hypothetical protein DFA_12286 [Cavenderia fasciculata]
MNNNNHNNLNKDFKSAIVIVPPQDLLDQVQAIRKQHDKSYERWMPHINLIFPFVKIDQFEEKHEQLQSVLSYFSSFTLVFKEFSNFQHGKSSVIWLKPETPDQPNAINQLQRILETNLPGFDELSNKSEAGFCPHMTVGQSAAGKQTTDKITQFQTDFKPIEFQVKEIYLIHRDGEVPFTIRKTLKLGGSD